MTQPWSKEINDELQPGMARLFASDNSEGNESPALVSDKNKSENIKYGNSVNHQGSIRAQSKPIFNVSNHVNSKQENLHQNQSSLKKGLNFDPKIQSNRALSSMLRKIQIRQNEPKYQNKFSNGFNENPSQLSNIQGMSNQNSNNSYPNQGVSSNSNSQNSQSEYQTNNFENSNQRGDSFLNNLRNSSFQDKADSFSNNSNQKMSNYNAKYPKPPPPKLPPEGRESPPFLSFGSDEGINPYQMNHKNPYDSTLTDALSESINGNKRFSSNDEDEINYIQKQGWNSNYRDQQSTYQNNQSNTQNRFQIPNDYQKTRIDQVNQLNQLKRVNSRNQTASLFTNAPNQESMNQEPSYYSSRENNDDNSPLKEFGLFNGRGSPNLSNQSIQTNQYGNFNQNSNVSQKYDERNGQRQFTPDLNDSFRLNSQHSNNYRSVQPKSQNFQNTGVWNNLQGKTLSLKERLYKSSSNNIGFQAYSQENQSDVKNNFKSPFQVENAKFQNDQQEIFSNFSQNSSLQNSLQDNLINNTVDNINEIDEDPEQREIEIIENLHYIQQAEPVKLEVLKLLMDRNTHPDCQLLREIKRTRYMGSVALGMILYNLIETFGSDMISKKYDEGNDIYSISERFSDLLEKTFTL